MVERDQPASDDVALIEGALRWGGRQVMHTVTTTGKVALWAERTALGALRSRMDQAAPSSTSTTSTAAPSATGVAASDPDDLPTRMSQLLSKAVTQGSAPSRHELFLKLLDQIVPDEARIISALSDGSKAPLISIHDWTPGSRSPVLENMSLIGRSANLALPNLTPVYVSHLLAIGLLEVGPEDESLKQDYEVLGAEPAVLAALKSGGKGPIPGRSERRTIGLTPLGLQLCEATGLRAQP